MEREPRASATAQTRRVIVGRFGAAHGVRGEIRLQSFTQNPSAIGKLKPLTDAKGERVFKLVKIRPVRDAMFVAQVEGIADRDAAEALVNTELYVERSKFPKAAKDEYYVTDLIGLPVFLAAGEPAGTVLNVVNYGAGDILEIRPPDGGETRLVPFTKAAVPDVDIAAGRVVIAPPAEIEAKPPEGGEDPA